MTASTGLGIAFCPCMKKSLDSVRLSRPLLFIFLTFAHILGLSQAFCFPSPYLGQAVPLLPSDAEIIELDETTDLGKQIDETTIEILSSPTGKLFCNAVPEDFESFKKAFFLGERKARKGFSLCEGHFSPQNQVYHHFQKKYFIVWTNMTHFPADGWTTPRNETFLFLSRQEFSRDRLVRSLAHELAISLDRKEQIGFIGKIDVPQLGIKDEPQACAAVPILREPRVKHALSTIRAFEVEKQISQELRVALPDGFAEWSQHTCKEKLNFIFPFMDAFATSLEAESLINLFMDRPLCIQNPLLEVPKDKIEALAQLRFTFADGSSRSVCDFMTEGLPFFAGTSFRGGPSPRIGGGGWSKLSNKEDHQ